VYGIGEASQFYFQKSHQNYRWTNACISLIPSQKSSCISLTIKDVERFCCKTRIVFDQYYVSRGLLTPEDTIYKSLPILISGPARSFIKFKVQDSTQMDSLAVEDEFDL
jgi:hypothetical protein